MDATTEIPFLMSDIAKKIRQIIRDKTLETFRLTTGKKHVEITDVLNPDDFLYGQNMGFVLIHGRPVKIMFKVHYSHPLARQLTCAKLGLSEASLDDESVHDFMREYCNLAAGYIADILARNNIAVDISIPLITDGFDEVWFSDRVRPLEVRDCWLLRWDEGEMTFTCAVTIRDAKALANIDLSKPTEPQKDTDNEGIKFL